MAPQISTAAVILCGGRSERMGKPKALLPFGRETLLERTIRLVWPAVDHVMVVAGPNQEIPLLDGRVTIVRDQQFAQGPLPALAAAWSALPENVERVFVSGCDTPMISAEVVDVLFWALEEYQAAVPFIRGQWYPLTAAYHVSIGPLMTNILAGGERRMIDLIEWANTRPVPAGLLQQADPDLFCLFNCNTPQEYYASLGLAGCPLPPNDLGP